MENLKRDMFLFIVFVIGILFMTAHLVAMLDVNSQILIDLPWLRFLMAYLELGAIFILNAIIIWFVLGLIIDYQIKSRQADEADAKVKELEKELERIKDESNR